MNNSLKLYELYNQLKSLILHSELDIGSVFFMVKTLSTELEDNFLQYLNTINQNTIIEKENKIIDNQNKESGQE